MCTVDKGVYTGELQWLRLWEITNVGEGEMLVVVVVVVGGIEVKGEGKSILM